MFDRFWKFDMLGKGRVQEEVEIAGSWPLLRNFLGLGFM
jgi:hypothetical protein